MDVKADGSGGAVLLLEPAEAALLVSLFEQQAELIHDPEVAGPDVARRLSPAAYPDDPLAEDDFRALIDSDLRAERMSHHDVVTAAMERARKKRGVLRIDLPPADVEAWLKSVNHLRLVLGTKLGVEQDRDYGDVRPDDPAAVPLAIFDLLGLLLELLLDATDR